VEPTILKFPTVFPTLRQEIELIMQENPIQAIAAEKLEKLVIDLIVKVTTDT